MVKFRNPGTQNTTFLQVFKELYKDYKDAESFGLDEMGDTIARTNLVTAYGYSGENALKLSKTKDRSRDTVFNNTKMYAEVFRLLGWLSSAGKGAYPLVFTFIGEHIAVADDAVPLLEQCLIGMCNPQRIMKVKYTENTRLFMAMLFTLDDLGGLMYKHELCLGPMSVNDREKKQYNKMIKYIKNLRGSYKNLQLAFSGLANDLGIQERTVDNSTRVPIALMKICRWVEEAYSEKLYPPKSLKCIKLTQHGRDLSHDLHNNIKDLRLDEYDKYPQDVQQALIRFGTYSMFSRAGYNVSPVKKEMEKDKKTCAKILQGKDLFFSPYQVLPHTIVDEALGIKKPNASRSSKVTLKSGSKRVPIQPQKLLLNIDTHIPDTKSEDSTAKKFIDDVQMLSNKGHSKKEIISKLFDAHIKDKKNKFYPFIVMLFQIMGYNCKKSRDNSIGSRWDAIIIDSKESIPIEIKSPTEERNISLKAIRQALENKVVLLSRESYPTLPDTTSLVVGYELPIDSTDAVNLICDFKKAYNIRIGIIDLKTLLTVAINIIIDKKTFDFMDLNRLEGIANAISE